MSTSNKAVDTTAGSSLRHPGDDARLPPDIGPGSTDVVVPMPGGGNGVNASRLASASFSPVTDGGSNPSVQNLLWGYKWGGTVMGQPVTLSYSLATVSSVYNYADNSNDAGGSRLPLNALQASAVVSTLAAYSAVARLSFNALTDNALQAGDLRYGNTDSPVVGTAYAYLPYYEALGGDVWFGDVFDYQNPVVGDYGYATFLHETGHALGLTHPHDADVAAVPGEDQLKYSVMSYRSYDGAPLTGYTGSAYPTSLMINDIQALQFLYGANTSHHAGNDTYSWLSGQVVFETLWDGGGIDTLDATSQAQGTVLYLTPGKWSQIGVPFFNGQSNVRDTLTIAYGAVIENAIGSAFADTLEGNAAGNVLSGGDGSDSLLGLGGNDTLDGGGGADRLVPGGGTDVVVGGAAGDTVELSGNLSAFTVSLVNATTLNLVSAAHNVTVSEVESFQFADGTRTLAQVLALATSVPTTGNDLLQGDDGDNLIDGLAGNDTLLGLGGNDTLIGGPGTDSLVGGPGDDVYRVDVATDVLLEEAAAGDDRVEVGLTAAGSTFIVPSNVEQAVITSTAAVHLTGPSTGARLVGNAAANRLNGGKGNDTLDGGAGIDTLVGNGGNDVYRLNLTTDVVTEPGATDFDWDRIELNLATAGSYTLPAGVEWLAVTHTAALGVSITANGLSNVIDGGPGNDTVLGGAGYDVLAGHDGNDRLDGGADLDTAEYASAASAVFANLGTGVVTGGGGNDTLVSIEDLVGSNHADSLTGDGNRNNLQGGKGNDTLAGLAGDDMLHPGDGHDLVQGGDGNDEVRFIDAGTGVQVDLNTGLASGQGSDTLTGVEAVIGSTHNDTLVGDSADNRFEPWHGDDSIVGGKGHDTLSLAWAEQAMTVNLATGRTSGGSGNDTFSGIERVELSIHDDTVIGSAADDDVSGGDGQDSITGEAGSDYLYGGPGRDTLQGGSGFDGLVPGPGGGIVDGGADAAYVGFWDLGGSVDVNLAGGTTSSGGDIYQLSSIQDVYGSPYADTLGGDGNSNWLSGNNGNDSISAGKGNDHLLGGKGSDTLVGGGGIDAVYFHDLTAGVVANLSLAQPTAISGIDTDRLIDITDLGGSEHADTLVGNAAGNWLQGRSGNDSLAGGDGNDTLVADSGNDTADGGTGADQLDVFGERSAWTVSRPNATDIRLTSATQVVTLRAIEHVAFDDGLVAVADLLGNTASPLDDTLLGTAGADSIDGLAGNDSIDGLEGNDTLVGGIGNDTLSGGKGDDVYRVDSLGDRVVEQPLQGVDQVQVGLATAGMYTLPAEVDNAVISSTAAIHLTGNALANELTGNAAANSLIGGEGFDTLDGRGGIDTLAGGLGDDTYIIEAPTDVVREDTTGGWQGFDTVLLRWTAAGTYTMPAAVERVMVDMASAFNLRIVGNAGYNDLEGGAGNDTLEAGAGGSYLMGRAGNDSIVGSSTDSDTVAYHDAPAGVSVSLATGRASGEGNDTLVAVDDVVASFLDDSITGNDGSNRLYGLDGNDTLNGGKGNDFLSPGAGDDLVDGGGHTDEVDYGGSMQSMVVDLVNGIASGWGTDTLVGIEGASTGSGDDELYGDGQSNHFSPGLGDDFVVGGDGYDTVDLGTAESGVHYDAGSGFVTGGNGSDLLLEIESVIASYFDDQLLGSVLDNVLDGRDGSDQITGDAGNDRLYGGWGNDTLHGGADDDMLLPGWGSDLVDGGTGIDRVSYADTWQAVNASLATGVASQGSDTDVLANVEHLSGGSGNDTLSGDGGDNIIDGGPGADLLAGGAGTDTADFGGLGSAVNASMLTAVSGGVVDTLSGFENLLGTWMNDTLTGDAGPNLLNGGKGNDSLAGGGGDDTLLALLDSDTVDGGTGFDTLVLSGWRMDYSTERPNPTDIVFRQSGNTITVRGVEMVSFADQLVPMADLLGNTASPGNDTLTGTIGMDSIDGLAGNDSISGLDDADTLIGGLGNDTLLGGPGDDLYGVDAVGDVLIELDGEGWDRVDVKLPTAGTYMLPAFVEDASVSSTAAVHLRGNAQDNQLVGNAAGNSLEGGAGNDWLDGGAGVDTLLGGDGDDGYFVNVTTDQVREDTGPGYHGLDTVYLGLSAAGTYVLPAGIENVHVVPPGSQPLAIRVTGNTESNRMYGTLGNETLEGGAGYDFLSGHAGNDSLDGGADIDTVSYADMLDAVVVNLGTGRASGGGGNDSLVAIENVHGTPWNDSITGSPVANDLRGEGGNDTLDGAGGDDTLGAGTGSELLRGGDGIDTVDMTGGPATRVDLPAGSATGQGNDTLEGIENVSTGAGNDTLIGNADNNRFDAGTGDDQVDGGDGYDTLVFWSATAGISLDVGAGVATGGAGNDSFVRIESFAGSPYGDTMTGTAGNDNLEGGGGNNSLSGLGGHDTLYAGKGNDTLRGGAGNDWLSAGKGSNLIDGGADIDDVSFASVSTGVQASLLTLRALHDSVTDTLAGIENLRGTGWADTLIGDAGSNVVDGGAGPDLLDGGNGIDTVAFGSLSAPVNLQLATGLAVSGGVTDTVAGFENAEGSGYNDTLGGDANDNRISGGKGNDSLLGGAGNDTLVAFNDNDTVDGGADTDTLELPYALAQYTLVRPNATDLVLSLGSTQVVTARGIEAVAFSDGTRTMQQLIGNTASPFDDTLSGSDGAETMDGLAGNDSLSGLGGDDLLIGGTGTDTLVGGKGNDVHRVDLAGDQVVELAGEGIDRIEVVFAAAGSYTLPAEVENGRVLSASTLAVGLIGNSGPNLLVGSGAANVLRGGGGNDTLDGEPGNDTLVGGLGDDVYVLNVPTDVVDETADGGAGTDTVWLNFAATGTYTLPVPVENGTVVAAPGVAVHITGNAQANVLVGHAGNNSLAGGLGHDSFTGSLGNDTVVGGDGIDQLDLQGSQADWSIVRPNATDAVFSSLGASMLVQTVEAVSFGGGVPVAMATLLATIGSPGNDTLNGGAGNQLLAGGAGADVINGGEGDDSLRGEAGNDTLAGGPGTDMLDGGDGNDVYAVGVDAGLDIIEQNDTVSANVDAIVLAAGITASDLSFARGFASWDDLVVTLDTSAGTQQLVVVDFYRGDAVNPGTVDQLRLASGQVFTTAQMAAAANAFDGGGHVFLGAGNNDTIGGDQLGVSADWMNGSGGNDSLSGLGDDDVLLGGNGNDTLLGGAGADRMAGGAGADVLDGGSGNDTLVGGAGADRYLFGLGGGSDVIAEALAGAGIDAALDSGLGPVYEPTDGDLPRSGETDVLQLGAGILPSQLLPARSGNDLLLSVASTSDQLRVQDYFAGGVPVIERIQFASGTAWSAANVRAMLLQATSGNDTIVGYSGPDNIGGGAGNDVLDGREGNDTLSGGAGADTLGGGSGSDRFVFGADAAGAVDTITDFVPGVDRIGLSKAAFAALAALPTGSLLDPDASAFVDYNPATGALSYDADGPGAGAAVIVALLGVVTHPAALGADIVVLP